MFDHLFAWNGETRCPKVNNPIIRAKAGAKYKEIIDNPDNRTGASEHWHKQYPELTDFTGRSLENIKIQVYAAGDNGSTITMAKSNCHWNNDALGHSYYGPSRNDANCSEGCSTECGRNNVGCEHCNHKCSCDHSPPSRGPVIYVTTAGVYDMCSPMIRKPLPVLIMHLMPHIMMMLGLGNTRLPCPNIGMMVGTCATMGTMHFDLEKYITKNWLHCVWTVYTYKTLNPI